MCCSLTEALRDSTRRPWASWASTRYSTISRFTPHRADAGTDDWAAQLPVTSDVSGRLLRLPLWAGLGEQRTEAVIEAMHASVRTTGAVYAR